MLEDRRKEFRFPVCIPVTYYTDLDEPFSSKSYDLSPNGISMAYRATDKIGDSCHLLFDLPHQEKRSQMAGEIRWYTGRPGDGKVGIQFYEPIDLPIPFSEAQRAANLISRSAQIRADQRHKALGHCRAWVYSDGRIINYDDSFLPLIGGSAEEIKNQPLHKYACDEDCQRLAQFVSRPRSVCDAQPMCDIFRMKPMHSTERAVWKIGQFPAYEWPGARELFIEDITRVSQAEEQNNQLKQTVEILKNAIRGKGVLLTPDLKIIDVLGEGTDERSIDVEHKFVPTDIRKATGIVNTSIWGRALVDELKFCVQTGQSRMTDWSCFEQHHAYGERDLFSPGPVRIWISPIKSLDGAVSSILMIVETPSRPEIINTTDRHRTSSLTEILKAAATSFVIRDALNSMAEPFVSALGRLDLLRHKLLNMEDEIQTRLDGQGIEEFSGDNFFRTAEAATNDVMEICDKLKQVLESTDGHQPDRLQMVDVSEMLHSAAKIAKIHSSIGECIIDIEPKRAGLVVTTVNENELVMVFTILLLFCRDSLKNIARKIVKCELQRNDGHVLIDFFHSGSVWPAEYLNIVFASNPLSNFFFGNGTICFMRTLLHYGNVLIRKNNLKLEVKNISGHFNLSVFVPTAFQQD